MTRLILMNEPSNDRFRTDLDDYYHSQILRYRTFIAYDTEKNTVTEYKSNLITGKKYHQQRRETYRWYRWFTSHMTQISITKSGQYLLRYMYSDGQNERSKRFFSDRSHAWQTVQFPTTYNPVGKFAKNIFDCDFKTVDVYPMAKYWDIEHWRDLPVGMPALKETNTAAFIGRLFGKKNYRKDLVKAAVETRPFIVNLASQFRGYVPVDWIIGFMRAHTDWGEPQHIEAAIYDLDINLNYFRRIVPLLTQRERRNLLNEYMDRNSIYLLTDIINRGIKQHRPNADTLPIRIELGRHNIPRVRNLQGIHDLFWNPNRRPIAVMREVYNGQTVDMDQIIPVTITGQEIAKRPYMVLPKTVRDLYDWSSYMGNCISSYASDVAKKNSNKVLGAVKHPDTDKIIANFEVSNNQLKQLLGKYNEILSADIRKMLEFEFREAGVTVPDHYWGKPEQEFRPYPIMDGWAV